MEVHMDDPSRSAPERRRDPRYEKTFAVEVGAGTAGGLKAESINISSRGLYCKVPRYLQPFSKLRVALDLPSVSGENQRVECEGVVVRVQPETELPGLHEYRLAIYFLDLDRASADLINRFLTEAH
jgi:hypothetical protein